MILDKIILYDYMRNSLSTRQLCKKYTEIKDSRGWKSHYILKKYKLEPKHKGILFLFSKSESLRIINNIVSKGKIDKNICNLIPNKLAVYQGSIIIAKNDEKAYNVLNGELRNIIQRIFKDRKDEVGICQYSGCKNKNLESAHRHDKNRKKIFFKSAKKFKKKSNDGSMYMYPVFDIIKDFLETHNKGVIFFLCKKHHSKYDRKNTDKKEFLKNLNF